MNYLKNHPFAIEAFFKSSLVLTFAVSKEELENLIPDCLTLDVFQDKWAFIAMAMVQTTGLKPKGVLNIFGNDFFLTGYRIFVRFTTKKKKRLRGLYILKSETDKKKMEVLGNIFTHYNYTTTDINQEVMGDVKTIFSAKSNFKIVVQNTGDVIPLPNGSPFSNWKEARRFAGPLPFTFTYDEEKKSVLIIEGVRKNWKPCPVKINSYRIGFLSQLNFQKIVLASAFEVKNVPYWWKKGRVEKWN